jgi:hypothetical protein
MIKLNLFGLWLVAAGLMAMMITHCRGHGFLSNPRSRMLVLGYDEYSASAGNGNYDLAPSDRYPDVCGDPHQGAVGNKNIKNQVTQVQATFSTGQTITVGFKIRVNHGGFVMIKICPRSTNLDQACFDQNTLTK